jgi:ABC-2 type transport system permease protein
MNLHAIRAIYLFEMARTWRPLLQSIVAPVISTSLYFVVFGAAIGRGLQPKPLQPMAAFRSRSALPITLTDESDIAAAAMTGDKRMPKAG